MTYENVQSYFEYSMNVSAKENFFDKMFWTVVVYVVLYTILYFVLGARLSSLMLLAGLVLFTPVICKIRNSYPDFAKFLFCGSCLFYIYATPFGIRAPMEIEFYYLVALMIPALLYNPVQRGWLFSCIILCPSVWAIQMWGPMPVFSEYWIPEKFPHEIFEVINFFGATLIMIIFLKYFVDQFHKQSQETEKALKEMDHFFNVAMDALCIGDENGRLKKTNPAFSELLGYSPEQLKAKPFFDLIHLDDLNETVRVFEGIKKGKGTRNFINRYQASDGSFKYLNWSASQDMELGLTYAAGRDITELVHVEEMAKTEKIKALQNAKLASLGEMSAGLAHEINNPLAIISASAQVIEKNQGNPPKLLQHSSAILKATDRIIRIVAGLKKYSRSSETVDFKNHSLQRIVQEALVLVEGKAKKYETEIRFNGESEAEIFCNEIEIEQVAINLISNSIDAVKNFEDRWVELRVFEMHNNVVLQIRDSGKGIDTKVAEKIFHPFFTTKQVGEGTGLGLSIVKGILEDHEATIELIKPDPHTCFELNFKKWSK